MSGHDSPVGQDFGQGEGVLGRAAAVVAGARVDLDQLTRDLDHRLQGLQGRWQGAGGSAFFALQRAWVDKQRVITGALDEFEASLRRTEKDNLATDDAQSAALSRTAQRLGGI